MKKLFLIFATIAIVSNLVGFTGCTRRDVGTATGAVVGGVVGNGIFGNPVGTIGGAVAGGYIGNRLSY